MARSLVISYLTVVKYGVAHTHTERAGFWTSSLVSFSLLNATNTLWDDTLNSNLSRISVGPLYESILNERAIFRLLARHCPHLRKSRVQSMRTTKLRSAD
jgi:hypothetical protein